jgi:glycosyltransferase involved in cell wall biosynthesis
MALRILVVDGLRHTKLTGYGIIARNLILGLLERGNEIQLQGYDREWEAIEPYAREILEELPRVSGPAAADVVLQIGTPPTARRKWDKPALIYTMNALGDLRPEWLEPLSMVDAAIVPSECDRKVFAKYLERVYVARLGSDPRAFMPDPDAQAQRWSPFTFLFVGSYSFRKGVDLLLEAFLTEFDPSEPVDLILQAAGARTGVHTNHLTSYLKRLNPNARVRMSGSNLSTAEMCRLYNQVDCSVTMTRGEGWCMPVTESLLCGTPVISPRSTAMAEYLTDDMADLMEVDELEVLALPEEPVNSFWGAFRKTYGDPGITYWEPRVADAQRFMRQAYAVPEQAREKAVAGRQSLLTETTWPKAAEAVERACADVVDAMSK